LIILREDTVKLLFHVKIEQKVEREQVAKVTGTNKDDSVAKAPIKREVAKVYPNDPCPCGSGKKYKQCCGQIKHKYLQIEIKVVTFLVELDQMKFELQAYENPLAEVRDSL
jgi:hypothetical protein